MNLKNGLRSFGMITFFFVTGAFFPVLNKIILKAEFAYKYGFTLGFNKPWFQVFALNFGMIFYGIPFLIHFFKRKCNKNVAMPKLFSWEIFRRCGLPSILYIVASVLQTYSLLTMPASVWQIFHGFQVLFTTLFAVTVLKQRLFLVDWLGVFMNVLGLCFSGVAALLRGITKQQEEISEQFFMMILAIVSHGIKSYQTVMEEKILKETKISSSNLTAYEGLWGLFTLVFICWPIIMILPPNSRLSENIPEAFIQFYYSKALALLFFFYIIIVVLFTYAGNLITQYNTAIRRNMYETIRPLFVWILSVSATKLLKKYQLNLNEDLDSFTFIELTGFLISIVGSLIYNRVWRCGCFIYAEEEAELLEANEVSQSLLNMSGDVSRPPAPVH